MPSDAASRAGGPDRADAGFATALFLVGLFGFLLSALGFAAALGLGIDVRFPLATNAGSAALVVGWLAANRLGDPTSGVTSVPGAVGTAMLLFGAYGLVVAVVVASTARWHGQFGLVWYLLGAAVVAGVLGAVTFPLEVVTGSVNKREDD
jgi:hypothetical protein